MRAESGDPALGQAVRVSVAQNAARRSDGEERRGGAAPSLRLVDGSIAPDDADARWLDRLCDRIFAAMSQVSTCPLLDVRGFGWTELLRAQWHAVQHEAGDAVAAESVCSERHPFTAAMVSRIPGLHSARFEQIERGARAMARVQGGRALLTCHLGLDIPREGDLRMRLGTHMVRWAEGETLLFDATQAQARWNDGARAGLVLSVTLRRPLRQPGRWLADHVLRRRA